MGPSDMDTEIASAAATGDRRGVTVLFAGLSAFASGQDAPRARTERELSAPEEETPS